MAVTKTIFHSEVSDEIETQNAISKEFGEKIFSYFNEACLFKWHDLNNNCEGRANAICLLLDEWQILNVKAWVFSGYMFHKKGFLKNLWKYHVAPALVIKENGIIEFYVVDPATCQGLVMAREWAENVTDNPHSYYLIKHGLYYIFRPHSIKKNNWYKRNKGNYNWTMQGLAGINGLSSTGKAQLAFNKEKVIRTKKKFQKLKYQKEFLTYPLMPRLI